MNDEVERLRNEAQLESRGHWSLDLRKRAAKLPLELLQRPEWAWLRAAQVALSMQPGAVRIAFGEHGEASLRGDQLDQGPDFNSNDFEAGDIAWLNALRFAAELLVAQGAEAVRLELAGSPDQSWTWSWTAGRGGEVASTPAARFPLRSLRLSAQEKRPAWWRPWIHEVWKAKVLPRVRERLQFAGPPLSINGIWLDGGTPASVNAIDPTFRKHSGAPEHCPFLAPAPRWHEGDPETSLRWLAESLTLAQPGGFALSKHRSASRVAWNDERHGVAGGLEVVVSHRHLAGVPSGHLVKHARELCRPTELPLVRDIVVTGVGRVDHQTGEVTSLYDGDPWLWPAPPGTQLHDLLRTDRWLALPLLPGPTCTLAYIQNGVLLDPITLPANPLPWTALLADRPVTTDISGTRIVHNTQVETDIQQLNRQAVRLWNASKTLVLELRNGTHYGLPPEARRRWSSWWRQHQYDPPFEN